MTKPQLTKTQIEDAITEAIMIGPLCEIRGRINQTAHKLHIEHSLVVRHYCVAMAEIALGIMENAKDTVWISNTQTAVEKVFSELAIDLPNYTEEGLAGALKEFINFQPEAEKEKENGN
jgi:hypothetical protein